MNFLLAFYLMLCTPKSYTFCESNQALLLYEASLLRSELKMFISLTESWVMCWWQRPSSHDAFLCTRVPQTDQFAHIEWRNDVDLLVIINCCDSCLGLWICASPSSAELSAFLRDWRPTVKSVYCMSKNCSTHGRNQEDSPKRSQSMVHLCGSASAPEG